MQAPCATPNMVRRETNMLQHNFDYNGYIYKAFGIQVLNPGNGEKTENLNLYNPKIGTQEHCESQTHWGWKAHLEIV